MVINTENERVVHSQRVVELLESDISKEQYDPNSELTHWANKLKVGESRFQKFKINMIYRIQQFQLTLMHVSNAQDV